MSRVTCGIRPSKIADEESISSCVRDELELNLVQGTRNLIRVTAVSTARDLDQNLAGGLLSNLSDRLRKVKSKTQRHSPTLLSNKFMELPPLPPPG